MAGAAASSSSSRDARTYDVFLSFRGDDTRNSFVSHLYGALDRRGIYTFKDDEKFEKGRHISEIIEAIEESKISIVVLSQKFADSSWCLDELVRILECKDVKRQEVLPIFYNVDPSHVRKQEGSFGEAFAKLQAKLLTRKRRRDETLELPVCDVCNRVGKWREALEEISGLSGYDTRNREEHVIVEEVVKKVAAKVHAETPSDAEDLVGMGSRLQNLDLLLDIGSNDVRFVGIWGMGGIGKTTIARAAYKKHLHLFDGCYFCPNVKESYRSSDPTPLQEELLCSVLKDRNLTLDFSMAREKIIEDRLRNKKVLIVLDDADKLDQLENLVGSHDLFGPGSRIIITTRDRHLLDAHGVDSVYEAEFLDDVEATILFGRHAFKKKHLGDAHSTSLSEKMVNYSKGLPLALRVLGSSLNSKSIEVWISESEKLKKMPKMDIYELLKVSYDALDENEKDIFLDIACFFKTEDRDYLRVIMDSSGFFGESGIQVLVDKSLITISNNRVEMHDLIQEMGREIVRRQSPKYPGKRSRLWLHDDICHVLESNKGAEAVEGLLLDLAERNHVNFPIEALSRLQNLRLLRIGWNLQARSSDYLGKSISAKIRTRTKMCLPGRNNADITGHVYFLSNELRCLHWDGYCLESLPSYFRPRNLTELSMCFSQIRQLWSGAVHLDNLKFLNLSHSIYLKATPDFSGTPNLEFLVLEGCKNLLEVHQSVGFLQRLVFLSLKNCVSLLHLPTRIKLKSLRRFVLSRCSALQSFPEIEEGMPNLKELLLDRTALRGLPRSVERLVGLTWLDLKGCWNFTYMPPTIWKLKSLRLCRSSYSNLQTFQGIDDDLV